MVVEECSKKTFDGVAESDEIAVVAADVGYAVAVEFDDFFVHLFPRLLRVCIHVLDKEYLCSSQTH